jgi:hypothetical protein
MIRPKLGYEKEGGIALGKLIEETRPGIPVLYTSGRALTDGMLTLFVVPSAFLPKPYTAQELTEAVEKLFSLETRSAARLLMAGNGRLWRRGTISQLKPELEDWSVHKHALHARSILSPALTKY